MCCFLHCVLLFFLSVVSDGKDSILSIYTSLPPFILIPSSSSSLLPPPSSLLFPTFSPSFLLLPPSSIFPFLSLPPFFPLSSPPPPCPSINQSINDHQVCISGLPRWLLDGEVCRCEVEVYNCGQVALNSLRLSSNLSHLTLIEVCWEREREELMQIYIYIYIFSSIFSFRFFALSFLSSILSIYLTCLHNLFFPQTSPSDSSVYPSTLTSDPPPRSTLPPLRLPALTPPPCVELPLPHGRLEPGEGVSAGLLLQATVAGQREQSSWDMLFYYEPALIRATSRIRYIVQSFVLLYATKKCFRPNFEVAFTKLMCI